MGKNPNSNSNSIHIGGIEVSFPYQPYGSQFAYMSKVISTLDRATREGHSHALLESPTGTGKSLSLLCSALAWQHNYINKTVFANFAHSRPDPEAKTDPLGHGGGFMPETQPQGDAGDGEAPPAATAEGKNKKKKTVPTIFYASRTHTQISQVVREYRKTTYRVPMSILASRKHYCTNEHISGHADIDEQCKLLLKNKEEVGCLHFKNANKVKGHPSLQRGGCHEVHDIEDLVKIGKAVKGCAYFAARSMADDAQLVFCPYNYVISPIIRRAMEIDITGSIVIFDEAHNIEDIARNAGSINVEEEELLRLQSELELLCHTDEMTYQPLVDMIQGIISWMDVRKSTLEKRGFQHFFSCWSGEKALKELKEANISSEPFKILQECATKVIKAASDADPEPPRLSGMASTILEGLISSLTFFFSREGIHVSDYELTLQRIMKRESGVNGWTNIFSLWCLNPAVVFKEIADLSLSVILTSGTLSPINSFSSELGVHFGTCLEAPHVIDVDSQLWTGVIPRGPGNYPLNASYKTADAYVFQDTLGKSLEEIFMVVPGGCLVFFPSYKLIEKLCSRWQETGQWSRLKAQKSMFVEPRGGNQENAFEPMLKDYYDTIRGENNLVPGRKKRGKKVDPDTKIAGSSPPKTITNKGAAFLAVCRGKVSEGVDFSDEFARVVIIVGIPFPNVNDIQVAEKKKFNDTYKSSKKLVSGNEWYCQQAFRAVNQATGRCIRHKFDYGAVIYLDERFSEDRNRASLSKWFRNSIKQYDSLDTPLEGLKSFFRDVKSRIGNFSDSVQAPAIDVTGVSCVQDNSGISRKKSLQGKKANQMKDRLKPNGGLAIEHTSQMLQTSYPKMNSLTHRNDIQVRPCAYENGIKGSLASINLGFESDEDSRMCEGEQSPGDPGLIMVNETPCSDGEISVATPESLTKNQNSFLTVHPSTIELPEQSSEHAPLINSSPDPRSASLMVTPERNISADMNVKEVKADSSFNWSVNSHVQKRRKSYGLSTVNHLRDEHMRNPIVKTPSSFHTPHLVMDQHLRIKCSICIRPLGLPKNNLFVTCMLTSSTKVYLKSLREASLRTLDVPVVICDVSSVDQKICNGTNDVSRREGIWCKEDGCVFKPIFCPFCCDSHTCLGIQVMATDASNVQLQDKILFYSDCLVFVNSDASKEEKNCCSPSTNSCISDGAAASSIKKFAYSPQEHNSGGWRTTNSKMRQPRGNLSTGLIR